MTLDANVSHPTAKASSPAPGPSGKGQRPGEDSGGSRKNLWIAAAAAVLTIAVGVTAGAWLGGAAEPGRALSETAIPVAASGRIDPDPAQIRASAEGRGGREERREHRGRQDTFRGEDGLERRPTRESDDREHHEEHDDEDDDD